MDRRIKKVLLYICMIFSRFVFMFPLAWAIICSFKNEMEIIQYPPTWIPKQFTLENYQYMIDNYPFIKWTINSIAASISATVLILLLASMASYAFARLEFTGKRFIYTAIITMLLLPIQSYVIPLYLLVNKLGLRDTLASLVLVSAANVTGVFILTNFYKTLPRELEEAARIDGCSYFGIYYKIILPLSKASLSSVAILSFISSWNSFLWPMISLRTDKWKPLSVGVATYVGSFLNSNGFQYGPSLAAACMAIVPTVLVYLFLQKNFVQGISNTGIKG
jgi:multiple sugar transport system permease protein